MGVWQSHQGLHVPCMGVGLLSSPPCRRRSLNAGIGWTGSDTHYATHSSL